jgi:hypothetical protein
MGQDLLLDARPEIPRRFNGFGQIPCPLQQGLLPFEFPGASGASVDVPGNLELIALGHRAVEIVTKTVLDIVMASHPSIFLNSLLAR